MIKSTYHLKGKLNERLILIKVCEDNGAEFKYDQENQWCVVTALDRGLSRKVRNLYDETISFAYKKLAMTRADPRFTGTSAKTVDSLFMKGFADAFISAPRSLPKNLIEMKGYKAGLEHNGH